MLETALLLELDVALKLESEMLELVVPEIDELEAGALEIGLLVELVESPEGEPPPQAANTSVAPSKKNTQPCRKRNNGFILLTPYGYTSHAGFYRYSEKPHYWKVPLLAEPDT